MFEYYDLFISHASEVKDEVARPLASNLISKGFRVWFDEISLKAGDSAREGIDKGIANSLYGLVIISREFLNKKWTNWELNGFVGLMLAKETKLIPVWYKIEKEEILKWSPPIADIVAIRADSVEDIIRGLERRTDIQSYLGNKLLFNESIIQHKLIRISDNVKILLFGQNNLPHILFTVDQERFPLDSMTSARVSFDITFFLSKRNQEIKDELMNTLRSTKYENGFYIKEPKTIKNMLTGDGFEKYNLLFVLPITQSRTTIIDYSNLELRHILLIALQPHNTLQFELPRQRFDAIVSITSEAYNTIFPFFDAKIRSLFSV